MNYSTLLACVVSLMSLPWPAFSAPIDLRKCVVVAPATLSGPEMKAVQVLVEEVEKRTQVTLPVAHSWPADAVPVIAVGQAASLKSFAGRYASALSGPAGTGAPEGYRIHTFRDSSSPAVVVAGNDPRGVLYGVGRLLRALRMDRQRIELAEDLNASTAPKVLLRGHQLGYRPKTNAYDAWSVPMWEQYIRDLSIFGTNAIELIPPRSDDADDSPHFPLPQMQMNAEMSRIANEYGMDVWVWYPALDKDYADPKAVEFALNEWAEFYRRMPRLDAVFVPGGDPGHTQPKHMFALLEKQAQSLRRFHPKAQMWMSPQGFNQDWMDEFFGLMSKEPAWLAGIVFGPQIRLSYKELRERLPRRYPIRFYPDITHSIQSQYPVPDWDTAFSLTQGREGPNPRPVTESRIFRLNQSYGVGFLTYSEGCNDDVNKFIWSGLGWDPDANVLDILRDFSRYFIGDQYADSFAQGLMALERNWQGQLLTNEGVYTTLQQFQELERAASPQVLLNWRFQQALYRAYYDAYDRSRLLYETALEDEAMAILGEARRMGPLTAMSQAQAVLERAVTSPVSQAWRARVHELAEALYQSIRAQLSVPRYKAIAVGRGANLDTIDVPLNNRPWLIYKFGEIRKTASETDQIQAIDEILNWTSPGPGGFYDDLGNLAQQSHLVRGIGADRDPDFRQSALVGVAGGGRSQVPWRYSWRNHAESMYDAPLEMRYTDLDPTAQYRVRVVYGGESQRQIRLTADEKYEVHPFLKREVPPKPVEFDIPPEATRDGQLSLKWYRDPGLGDNGRGAQVSEVWLIRK
jgi:hypothetical protein